MFFGLFGKKPEMRAADALYAAMVAQARAPAFYARLGVPDTRGGRLDMLMLHVYLVSRRLRGDSAAEPVAQALVDRFAEDMDDNMREEGVADTRVPKKMKAIVGDLLGRSQAYERALEEGGEDALAAALARNVYGRADADGRALADYVHRAMAALAAQPPATLKAGTVSFPAP